MAEFEKDDIVKSVSTQHPSWWKEGTVVRILAGPHSHEGKIGILGPFNTRISARAVKDYYNWRELITLDDTPRPVNVLGQPDGWWLVNVNGVKPVEEIDV